MKNLGELQASRITKCTIKRQGSESKYYAHFASIRIDEAEKFAERAAETYAPKKLVKLTLVNSKP